MLRPICILVSKGLLGMLLSAWMPASAVTGAAEGGPADLEQLEQRVNAYFNAVHARRFNQARGFILPSSRDTFDPSGSGKTRVGNLRIVEVALEEDGRSAVVTISRLLSVPAGSVTVKEKYRWKLESGQWFLDPADPPKSDAEIFREYYYDKLGSATQARFEETVFDFGTVVQGDTVRPRFSFRNPSSRDLVVERVHAPDRLITDRTEKRVVPAGESGEILLDLDTARLHLNIVHDFFVQFEPVKEMVKLRITGTVYTAEEVANSPILSRELGAEKSPDPAKP